MGAKLELCSNQICVITMRAITGAECMSAQAGKGHETDFLFPLALVFFVFADLTVSKAHGITSSIHPSVHPSVCLSVSRGGTNGGHWS